MSWTAWRLRTWWCGSGPGMTGGWFGPTSLPKGRATIEGVFPGHVDFVRNLVKGLEPEDQDTLRTLLKKLGKGIAGTSDGRGEC